jgi:deoxyribodipyrimidine photolyase-related protein
VLGDQLSHDLASLKAADRSDTVVLIAEVMAEASYVRHHKKKIAFLFAAMRHFADELRAAGWRVDYVRLDDPANGGSLDAEVARAAKAHGATRIVTVEAGEWRVLALQQGWGRLTGLPVAILPDDRFFTSRAAFEHWAKDRKRLVMEDFYREMRAETGILMDRGKPAGGRWNFDAENRKPAPKGLRFPDALSFAPDAVTREVLALVAERFAGHFGDIEPFGLPVTRADALKALDHFVHQALPQFGDYQDAMVEGEDLLFHSFLSPAINAGLLGPREVCAAAERAHADGHVPLNAAEGFIRQILGWREYIRGIYWHARPDYQGRNFLDARRPLPDFYWTGETEMRCLAQAVDATRRNAYAHHIQRLMVLGNFALIAGLDPADVQAWFLVVYADAYEWVESPNVAGMALHADGGLMASKPYAASGAYINRMSDHCRRCHYDVKRRTGDDACPFNSLYWDFLARNRDKLGRNHRLFQMYRGWDRFDEGEQHAIRARAAEVLDALVPARKGWAVAS